MLKMGMMSGVLCAAALWVSPAAALELPAPSPAAKVVQTVGVTKIKVKYSSPGVKGRAIWGKLVPYGKLWRTGANRSTRVSFSNDVQIGGKTIKAGKYNLFTIPNAQSWTVILNADRQLGGINGYDKKKNVLEVAIKPVAIPSRERLTFIFANTTENSTELQLEWEKVRISIAIQVDTKKLALANIKKALSAPWRPHFMAARYFLSIGDVAQAESNIDKSLQIQSVWWNNWVKSSVLAKKGDKAGAIKYAQEAAKLGANDRIFKTFFKAGLEKSIAAWSKK